MVGNNTLTFDALPRASNHADCVLTVTDSGNHTKSLTITPFHITGMNDTGITLCGDYAFQAATPIHNNDVVCSDAGVTQTTAGTDGDGDPVPAGQDALYGRDANAASNSDAAGAAGFSYTKLSKADGAALAIQNGVWDVSGTEAAGTQWGCVVDNVTGLFWEVKTSDNASARYVGNTYSWYDTNASTNGGNAGTADGGTCGSAGPAQCDTESYVAYVNAQQLCGFSDWRMPSIEELLSLVNQGKTNTAANADFLGPIQGTEIATQNSYYWSGSTFANNITETLNVAFNYGREMVGDKVNGQRHVRLVRGGR